MQAFQSHTLYQVFLAMDLLLCAGASREEGSSGVCWASRTSGQCFSQFLMCISPYYSCYYS